MRGRRLFILIAVPFVIACAIALWLTRPMPAVVKGEAPGTARPVALADGGYAPTASAPVDPRPIVGTGAAAAMTAPEVQEPPRPPSALPRDQWPEQLRGTGRTTAAPAPIAPQEEEVSSVSKDDIRRAIRSVTPLIRQCFEDAAEKNPGDHRVVLRFTIEGQGTSGRMDEGEIVESSIVDPWVQACFLESLTDAQFPAPSGGGTVTVTYPFAFTRRPDAGSPTPPPTGNAAE